MAFVTIKQESKIIPLAVLCITLSVILLIPFKIIGYGYLPPDDALRHAAKVMSEKSWNQILVLRAGITMDSHPGWHTLLGFFHNLTHCNIDGLLVFEITSLFLLFNLIPFIYLQRTETWILSLVVVLLANPVFIERLFLGRPYIFTMAVVVFILFIWPRFKEKRFPWGIFITAAMAIAASTWIHCLWFAFALPLAAFIAAREWRVARRLANATAIGIVLGAFLTGAPLQFFSQTLTHTVRTLGDYTRVRTLATEFYPSSGNVLAIIAIVLMLGWRALRGKWDIKSVNNPVFILAILSWVLSLRVGRFWADWGLPAILVWMAQEFDAVFQASIKVFSWKRITLAGLAVITLYLMTTTDIHSRWTESLNQGFLSQEDTALAGWMPEEGGILYSASMNVFYRTFYKNPKAPWRYILGFEPTMMPDEDLAIYRKILWNFGALEAYKPWVKKMKPADRLIISNPSENPVKIIPELQWLQTKKTIFIGRRPKNTSQP
jgi:hypothetical protein